jgi:hypothetical protein
MKVYRYLTAVGCLFALPVLLLILTLWLQCAGVAALIEWLRRVAARDIYRLGPIRSAALVVEATFAIIYLYGLVILLWAGFYRMRCFPSWGIAFYFSSASYSTVGYGDVVLPSQWRLLGPLESMTGVLMGGLSVSLLFVLVSRLINRGTQSVSDNHHFDATAPGSASEYSNEHIRA